MLATARAFMESNQALGLLLWENRTCAEIGSMHLASMRSFSALQPATKETEQHVKYLTRPAPPAHPSSPTHRQTDFPSTQTPAAGPRPAAHRRATVPRRAA